MGAAAPVIPAVLRPQRDFLRFWWARLANTCASQMLMVAVGWQMYDLTGSAWDLGLVGLLQFLPALALVLVTGDVVDRHHRARVAAACVGVQAAVALVLALAPLAGGPQRGWLLALAVVLGTAKAFQMPAQQALAPLLVPRRCCRARWPSARPACSWPSSPGRRSAACCTWPAPPPSTPPARCCSPSRPSCCCA